MADSTIAGLSAVTDLIGTDEYVLMRSGTTYKIDGSDLATEILALGAGSQVQADGWTADADTWTYASSSTFTVSGNVTATFQAGTRLKFTQTTVKYAVVVGSSHSSGTTTVTIAVNTDYVLANAAISATYYSYMVSPQGYPDWFGYTPTYTGFSAAPAAGAAKFRITGRTCTVHHTFVAGTSNATGFTISVPVTAATSVSSLSARTQNNGAVEATPGLVDINATQSAIGLYRTGSASAWTGSSTKAASFQFDVTF